MTSPSASGTTTTTSSPEKGGSDPQAASASAQASGGLQVSLHVQVANEHYAELDVEFDPHDRAYWCFLRPKGSPSYTPGLLQDLIRMWDSVKRLQALYERDGQAPIRFVVGASRCPGIFSYGGDLRLFADLIRSGNRAELEKYARTCIEVLHRTATSFNLPVVTIALVQGEALGGGFESALSCNVIIAERSAKFGLPEILFNLFPGMGAYSLLARRLDAVRAEKMILSGRIYSAEELHGMGLVEVLAEDGKGEEAVRDYIARHGRRHGAQRAIYRVRDRVLPLAYAELADVTKIWVDTALRLGEQDLRKMERLAAAQSRRCVDPVPANGTRKESPVPATPRLVAGSGIA
jgi:DSF synthase